MSSRLPVWNGLNDPQIPSCFFFSEELEGLDSAIRALEAKRAKSIDVSMKGCIIGKVLLFLFLLPFSPQIN